MSFSVVVEFHWDINRILVFYFLCRLLEGFVFGVEFILQQIGFDVFGYIVKGNIGHNGTTERGKDIDNVFPFFKPGTYGEIVDIDGPKE